MCPICGDDVVDFIYGSDDMTIRDLMKVDCIFVEITEEE
jgi:hypothetical protein